MGTLVRPIDFLTLRPLATRDPPPACTPSSDDGSDNGGNGLLVFARKRGAGSDFDDEAIDAGPGRLTGDLTFSTVMREAGKRGFGTGVDRPGTVGVLNTAEAAPGTFAGAVDLVGRLLADEEASLLFVNNPSPGLGATFDLSTSLPFVLAAGWMVGTLSAGAPVCGDLAKETERDEAGCVAGRDLKEDAAVLSWGAGGETGSGLATSFAIWKTNGRGLNFLARFLATCMRGRRLSRGDAGGACDCDDGSGALATEPTA